MIMPTLIWSSYVTELVVQWLLVIAVSFAEAAPYSPLSPIENTHVSAIAGQSFIEVRMNRPKDGKDWQSKDTYTLTIWYRT